MPNPFQIYAAGRLAVEAAAEVAPAAESLTQVIFKDALAQIFKRPPKLAEALPRLAEAFEVRGEIDASLKLPEFARAIKAGTAVGDTRITKFLGVGGGDFALATEHGTALKIGDEALLRPIPNTTFDARVLQHGQLGENTFFYTQALGNTAKVTDEHVLDVVKRMRTAGYVEDDIWSWVNPATRREQVALFGKAERPFLIDQGCAIPRYGSRYENGRLVADATQRENLIAMRSYLTDNKIALNMQEAKHPLNPTNAEYKMLSPQMTDQELGDAVRLHMAKEGRRPTMAPGWDADEVHLGLKTLTIK